MPIEPGDGCYTVTGLATKQLKESPHRSGKFGCGGGFCQEPVLMGVANDSLGDQLALGCAPQELGK